MSEKNRVDINVSGDLRKGKYYKDVSDISTDNIDTSPSPRKAPQSQGIPLTPLQSGATLINLVLATGPFSYPYSFVK